MLPNTHSKHRCQRVSQHTHGDAHAEVGKHNACDRVDQSHFFDYDGQRDHDHLERQNHFGQKNLVERTVAARRVADDAVCCHGGDEHNARVAQNCYEQRVKQRPREIQAVPCTFIVGCLPGFRQGGHVIGDLRERFERIEQRQQQGAEHDDTDGEQEDRKRGVCGALLCFTCCHACTSCFEVTNT